MDGDKTRIILNISGTKYEVDADIFSKIPNTRLAKLTQSLHVGKSSCFYFNRPASMFESILSYYQTGELHMPGHVCPKAFQLELKFWDIDSKYLERCCMYKYMTFMDDMENRDKFFAAMFNKKTQSDENPSLLTRIRNRVWSVLDHRENSAIAKVYFGLAIGFVLLSIFSLALSTIPFFQQPLNTCELKEFLQTDDYYMPFYLSDFLNNLDCQSIPQEVLDRHMDYFDDDYIFKKEIPVEKNKRLNHPIPTENQTFYKNVTIPQRVKRFQIFHSIDFAVTAFFTIELIFRICSCPSLKTYMTSVLNVLEAVVLLTSYIHVILESLYAKFRHDTKGLEILLYLQMLRVVRLFRVMQNITAIKVLTHSVRTGYKDLIVLMLYMFIGIIVFANFTYFAEDSSNFPSIPQAWWWGMVTMTTVGYGDIAPKSVIGKLIASICVLTGIILMSLVIPLFVNTFVQLYQFARIQDKLQIKRKHSAKSNSSKPNEQNEPIVGKMVDMDVILQI